MSDQLLVSMMIQREISINDSRQERNQILGDYFDISSPSIDNSNFDDRNVFRVNVIREYCENVSPD